MMNAKVGFVFYFVSIFLAFFSRRIFLECLGDEFIGLAGTLSSILDFLNITEIGIGTCIAYFLYKPIEEQNREKICEIVSLIGYLYRIIGSIIFCGAVIVSLFFPLIFADKGVSMGIVYFAFYSFLGSQLIFYFINYRQILLDSDQKNYKISIWTQTFGAVTTILQIALAYYTHNPFLWVIIQFLLSVLTCFVLNYVINREYPWLRTDKNRGREILKKYPEILAKAKQIFIHRMKNFFLSKSDEILIFAFESLQMVAYYGNYVMIVGKLTGLFNQVLVGTNASIGNLVAEGNKWNIRKVFWEYLTFRYWTTGVLIIGLTFLINPIISCWVGPQYVLQNHLTFLIMFNMYIMLTGPSVALFINAYGLYDDTWSAYTEGAVNLVITVIVGWNYGLVGILLGKAVSLFLFAVLWRAIYLYRKGFQESSRAYWIGLVTHVLLLLFCLFLNYLVSRLLDWNVRPTLAGIIAYGACITLPIIIVYSLLVYCFAPGAKDLVHRLPIRKRHEKKNK